jgi:hypothetical protein
VGGIGAWEGHLEVYSVGWPDYSPNIPPTCLNRTNLGRAARGEYIANGTYYETFDTDTYFGISDVKFNKTLLWGSATGTDTRAVYQGEQIIEKEWHFELDITTEDAYNAALPP